jgi:hypothetical protein
VRVTALEQDIFFCAPDEEGGGEGEHEEAFETDVPAVHYIIKTPLPE